MVHLPSNVNLSPLNLGRGRLQGNGGCGGAFFHRLRRLCLEYCDVISVEVILSNVMLLLGNRMYCLIYLASRRNFTSFLLRISFNRKYVSLHILNRNRLDPVTCRACILIKEVCMPIILWGLFWFFILLRLTQA